MDEAARSTRDPRVSGLLLVGAMIALMWVTEGVDALDGHRLDAYGIRPRSEDGLIGVVAAPFLHVGFGHLISNTLPFAVMGGVIALSGAARVLAVTAVVALVSGLGTWAIASSNSVHLGASGVVFGYATYLLSRGAFSRNLMQIVVGVVVAAVWGVALLGGLLPQAGISWQAHLFGAIGGVLAARLLRGSPAEPTRAAPAV